MVRSPFFEVAPSRCLPPVDLCNGVSPSQAAKSRPVLNVSAAGASAKIAVAVIGPMPRYRHQSASNGVLLGTAFNLDIQNRDVFLQRPQSRDQDFENGPCALRQLAVWIFNPIDQLRNMRRTLGNDVAIFRQVPSKGVDTLRLLPYQHISGSKHHPACLLSLVLHRDKPHVWSLRGFTNCFRISGIVLRRLGLSGQYFGSNEWSVCPVQAATVCGCRVK